MGACNPRCTRCLPSRHKGPTPAGLRSKRRANTEQRRPQSCNTLHANVLTSWRESRPSVWASAASAWDLAAVPTAARRRRRLAACAGEPESSTTAAAASKAALTRRMVLRSAFRTVGRGPRPAVRTSAPRQLCWHAKEQQHSSPSSCAVAVQLFRPRPSALTSAQGRHCLAAGRRGEWAAPLKVQSLARRARRCRLAGCVQCARQTQHLPHKHCAPHTRAHTRSELGATRRRQGAQGLQASTAPQLRGLRKPPAPTPRILRSRSRSALRSARLASRSAAGS